MERLPAHHITVDNVSSHAVTRYVQRVLGVTLPLDEAKVGNQVTAQRHSEACGLTIDQVKLMILCPEVRQALALGAVAVRTSRFKAVINHAQRLVVTIKHRTHSPGFQLPRRFSETSRTETRRRAHQFIRRDRAKHKGQTAS